MYLVQRNWWTRHPRSGVQNSLTPVNHPCRNLVHAIHENFSIGRGVLRLSNQKSVILEKFQFGAELRFSNLKSKFSMKGDWGVSKHQSGSECPETHFCSGTFEIGWNFRNEKNLSLEAARLKHLELGQTVVNRECDQAGKVTESENAKKTSLVYFCFWWFFLFVCLVLLL